MKHNGTLENESKKGYHKVRSYLRRQLLDLVLYYRKASTSASQQGAAIIPRYGSGGIRASGVGN